MFGSFARSAARAASRAGRRAFSSGAAGSVGIKGKNIISAMTVGAGSLAVAYALRDNFESAFTAYAAEPTPLERTYIMIKPDGVNRALIGEIIKRFESKGFYLVAIKMVKPSKALAEAHYAEHSGKAFFKGLVEFLCSGPVVGMVWEGKDVIKGGRTLLGVTSPLASPLGTIRGDLAVSVGRNVIHASDSLDNAKDEIGLWFKPEELVNWQPTNAKWIYE